MRAQPAHGYTIKVGQPSPHGGAGKDRGFHASIEDALCQCNKTVLPSDKVGGDDCHSAMAKSDFSCVETHFFFPKSPLRIGFPSASTEVVHRPRSQSPLHFDIRNR